MSSTATERWPLLPVADWADTRDTLHLYTQVVGKVRLANEPLANHWWNSTLYVTAKGLTTSLMPHPSGTDFQIDFDFTTHELKVVTVEGRERSIPLEPRSVADFYADVTATLDDLGVGTEIWPMPVEIADAIPFAEDHVHASYDPDAVRHVVDFYKGSNALIGTKGRISGLSLIATDADFRHGEGQEVAGPLMSLLMAMTGRAAACDDLTGPGVDRLRAAGR